MESQDRVGVNGDLDRVELSGDIDGRKSSMARLLTELVDEPTQGLDCTGDMVSCRNGTGTVWG